MSKSRPHSKKDGLVVVLALMQGRVYIITDENDDPTQFKDPDAAQAWINERPTGLIRSAENVVIIDMGIPGDSL